jgi:hypothetical protein
MTLLASGDTTKLIACPAAQRLSATEKCDETTPCYFHILHRLGAAAELRQLGQRLGEW